MQSANTAMQQIAQINEQLATAPVDSSTASLEDQRDQDITQLAQLMNVTVVQNPDNQISIFTGTGQQLVSGIQASTLSFNNVGTMTATSLWSATPSQDAAGTITLTSPSGTTTGSDRQRLDPVGPDRRLCADARQHPAAGAKSARRTGQPDVAGAVEPDDDGHGGQRRLAGGLQRRCRRGVARQLGAAHLHQFQNVLQTITIVSLGDGGTLPLQTASPNTQMIGIDFSGGISSVVSQLNTALGTNLQFSNPSGTLLQVLNASGSSNVVNSLSATATVTSLTSGSAQLPLFTDDGQPITGAITADGSQITGLRTIAVNSAVVASPSSLVVYASNTTAGDRTRPNFMLNQMTTATLTYPATTGLGSATQPYSGTLTQYLSQVVSQQSQAANAATNLQQGQDTVLTALQQRFNDQSGVNIDTEMSNLIALQNAYGANARVMTTIQQMMATLLQIGS